MVMVSTWPRDFPGLGTGAQRLAKRISDMTDGRIQVQSHAAKERVGAFDSFDEVASGNAQAYHAADYYWKGKHLGWAYFTTVPFGPTYTEVNAWIRFGGGQALWDELAGDFGLKCMMAGNTGEQMGGWFNKEINSADDFKGLKMRIPGLGGKIYKAIGVNRAWAAARSSRRWSAASSTRPNGSVPCRTGAWVCTRRPRTTTTQAGTNHRRRRSF